MSNNTSSNSNAAPATLLELAGGQYSEVKWSNCAIVFIDFQNEYVDGAMPLGEPGAKATKNARLILDQARKDNRPIFHIAHHGEKNDGVFDPSTKNVDIVESLQPIDGEKVITKKHPNAFYNTSLQADLESTAAKQVLFVGFMSHMCVSSSVRAAFDLGFECVVARDACATRALPDPQGNTISADTMHNTAMAAIHDRFTALITTDKLLNN